MIFKGQDLKKTSLNYLKYIASQKNLGLKGNKLINFCELEIKRRTIAIKNH
tara:strand:- start:24 stop:176 length:153 start_codon:yes stop_codon:yes gene_type:complete